VAKTKKPVDRREHRTAEETRKWRKVFPEHWVRATIYGPFYHPSAVAALSSAILGLQEHAQLNSWHCFYEGEPYRGQSSVGYTPHTHFRVELKDPDCRKEVEIAIRSGWRKFLDKLKESRECRIQFGPYYGEPERFKEFWPAMKMFWYASSVLGLWYTRSRDVAMKDYVLGKAHHCFLNQHGFEYFDEAVFALSRFSGLYPSLKHQAEWAIQHAKPKRKKR